jgi:5-methylthioadenosine/S-adenosylhomocysteine deaminase
MDRDILIAPGWIIPVEPHDQVLEHHALVVRAGRIETLAPVAEAARAHPDAERVDLPGEVLIPGLVNAHTHAAMNLFRGLADDLPLEQWLARHIWPAESRWVSPEFVRDGTRHAIAEMLLGGVTCFSDMYFFPDQVARTAAECGIRSLVGLIVIDFASPWARDIGEYLAKGAALHDEYRNHPLVRTGFAPHAPYSVPDEALARIATVAEELDLQIVMHVNETAAEVERSLEERHERPLERLQRLGLLSPRLMAVHLTQLLDREIEQLAHHGVNAIHCPESNLKLASGFCPVQALKRAGINVALGTDGAASNNDLDMFGEMRTAALIAKAVSGDSSALAAGEVLRMATIDGARALAMSELIGSLVPGKAADMVAVDLGGLHTQPVYDPLSQLVYAAGRGDVTHVWVAGRRLVRDRRLTLLDAGAIVNRSAAWRARIRAADRDPRR